MVPWVYVYVQNHQIVNIKHVQLLHVNYTLIKLFFLKIKRLLNRSEKETTDVVWKYSKIIDRILT